MPFFRKIRFFWNLSKALFKKHYLSFLVSLVLAIVLFFFLAKTVPFFLNRIPEFKRVKKIAFVGKFTQEDLPPEILRFISLGLTQSLEDGATAPGLAESWVIKEEGKKYFFKLKDEIFWQDGTPITSHDINYQFAGLEKEVIDDKNFIFSLPEPFSPFLNVVSLPVFKKRLVGAGAYRVKKIKKEKGLVRSLDLSGPKENISFRFYPTLEAAITGFKLGEVDILENLLNNPFAEEWQDKLEVREEVRENQFAGLFFNTQGPNLGNKTLRQALAYALKKDYENRATSPLSPKSWAFNSDVKTYDYSEEKAREFLKESQEGEGDEESDEKEEGEKSEKNEEKEKIHEGPLSLEIATSESFLKLAEEIKKSWEEVLGITVNIKIINSLPPDFQVLLTAMEVPLDPDQYLLWHSTQPGNITHFESPKIDKLLEDARKITDQTGRKEKYLDFQRFLSEELPVLFLYHPTVYTIRRK